MNLGIIQVRSQSSRFTNKCKAEVNGVSLFELCLNNCTKSTVEWWVIVSPIDDPEREWFRSITRKFINVSLPDLPDYGFDLLTGYIEAIKWYEVNFNEDVNMVVRVTADCPFIKPLLIDEFLAFAERMDVPIEQLFYEESLFQIFRKKDYIAGDKLVKGTPREHACTPFRYGFIKGSIDTPEEFEEIKKIKEKT